MEQAAFILAVFVGARVMGRIAERLHQPSSVGEVIAGAVLALALAQAWPGLSMAWLGYAEGPTFEAIVGAGVFLLLLRAGVEMEPSEILQNSRTALWVAIGGSVLPLALGAGLGWLVLPAGPLKPAQMLILGTGLAISAVPVAARVLLELGVLHQRVGEVIITAAVFDDVFGLVLLAAVAGMIAGTPVGAPGVLILIGEVVVFFVLAGSIGHFAVPPMLAWLARHGTSMPVSGLIAVAIAFGLLAEGLELHFVLGPFMAGLFLERARVGEAAFERVKHVLDVVTFGALGPLFFASIGLKLDTTAVVETPVFLAALLFIAFAGKVAGAGLAGRWSGLAPRDALSVGVGLSGRGAIELVIADVALRTGAFHPPPGGDPYVENLFSALVITAVVTTILTPVLLRRTLG